MRRYSSELDERYKHERHNLENMYKLYKTRCVCMRVRVCVSSISSIPPLNKITSLKIVCHTIYRLNIVYVRTYIQTPSRHTTTSQYHSTPHRQSLCVCLIVCTNDNRPVSFLLVSLHCSLSSILFSSPFLFDVYATEDNIETMYCMCITP